MTNPGGDTVWRARVVVACLGLTALCFRQAPGLVVPDTKLDLTADPGGFLARALHLWDPHGAFGQLQNQAYGYLLPMGPFHWLLDLATVPGWVIQRLWWSVVLCVAFTGVWRLSGALRIGVPWARFVAALLYALSPRMLGEVSITSVEVWPMAMAPWVLLPLVLSSSDGAAARGWRWRISWSAVAFALVGGVNAVASGAVLILPALWFLTRRRTGQTLAATGAWMACVLLVSVWWLVPLVLLGRYSPPFLDWIEDASVTTGTASVFESFRGTSHWLNFLATSNGPSWPAGWLFVTSPALILQTTLVAVLGLAGLATRSLRHRGFLALGAAVGLLLLTLGHAGSFSGPVQDLLDGPLAAFRNTHKFELVLRLPLLLAAAHALSRIAHAVHWSEVTRPVSGRVQAREPAASLLTNERHSWVVPFLAVCLTVSVVTPGLIERMPRPEGYGGIAQHWRDAAGWLDAQPAQGTVLVVPAAPFADFTWGSTKDEPFQALMERPLAVRDAVPLGSAGATRWLDEIERRLGAGLGGTELRTALARAGVRFVVVRNDLRTDAQGSHPIAVHQALARSGLIRAASFGPSAGSPIESAAVTLDERTRLPYPSIEVYDVGPAPRAVLVPASQLVTSSGGPEDVPSVTSATGAQATVVGSDRFGHERLLARADDVLTDGYQRREVAFGRAADNTSPVLSADDPGRQRRGVVDYESDPEAGRTTRTWGGLTGVRASSSASDANATLRLGPGYGPQAAVDGDPGTRWVSGAFGTGAGEWLELRFAAGRPVQGLQLSFPRSAPASGIPRTVRVDTDAGSATTALIDTDKPQAVATPDGSTQWLRVTVIGVTDRGGAGVSIGELIVPGVTPVSRLRLPPQQDGAVLVAPEWIVLRDRQPGRSGCLHQGVRPLCTERFGTSAEDATGIRRTIELGAGATYTVSGTVLPRDGDALERLLAVSGAVTAKASSRAVTAPEARPGAAVDRNLGTGWVAAPQDTDPKLTLTLPEPRRLTGLQFLVDQNLAASRPREVTVTLDGRKVSGTALDDEGYLRFPARTARRVVIEFGPATGLLDVDSVTGFRRVLPVGVSEIRLQGADDTRRRIAPGTPTGSACGFGPDVQAGPGRIATRVRGTLGDVLAGRPLRIEACDDLPGQPQLVRLGAGLHTIDVPATGEFRPLEVRLTATSAPAAGPSRGEEVPVGRDAAAEVTVELPARDEDSVLRLAQNHSAGWVARDGSGRELTPIRLDGWQQGWVVPAGEPTRVTASFAPDRDYRLALLIGLGCLLLVAGLAVVTSARDRRRARSGRIQVPYPAGAEPPPWPVLLAAGGAAGLLVLGGAGLLAVLAGAVAAWLLRRRTAYRVVLLTVAGLVAGQWVALSPWNDGNAGVYETGIQALVLGAVALAVLVPDRGSGGGETS